MVDQEQKEIMQGTLGALKNQVIYLRNLHDAFSALHAAVLRATPQVEYWDHEEMKKIRQNPVQQSQLDAIDVLLQRLENSQ